MPSRDVTIVTGAAAGIGLATAVRLADEGHDLALVDVDEAGVERACAGIDGAEPFVVDLRDGDAIDDLVASIVGRSDRIAAVVNNAGTAVRATVVGTSPDDWNRILAVNVTAAYRLCRAAVPAMIRAGGGAIVNVASTAGLVGIRERAAYCASKAAVIGLTRAMAADHAADGLRVNAICPGTVETGWIERILAGAEDPAAARAAMEGRQLDGRLGAPEEVAAGIAFLLSDDARFVNGSAFVMDGGMTAV